MRYQIAEARKLRDITQAELAEKMGTTQQTIQRYETNQVNIRMDKMIEDSSFINNTLAKQAFGIGTVMDVELDITQEFSEDLQAFTNKKYEIKEVIDVTKKPENQRLFN